MHRGVERNAIAAQLEILRSKGAIARDEVLIMSKIPEPLAVHSHQRVTGANPGRHIGTVGADVLDGEVLRLDARKRRRDALVRARNLEQQNGKNEDEERGPHR
jgi:hypothetical protein